ncbi:MAG TPA: DoxX family protein [Flavobacteriales bacterium]
MSCPATSCFPPNLLLQLGFAAMVAILFLQSGLDKVFDRKGNLEWLTGHFGKSPLKGMVPLLLSVITLLELSAGLFSAAGFVAVLLDKGGACLGTIGMALGMAAIVSLFFGQRVAKDYAGAASLVPYFLLCAGGLYVFGTC